MARSLSFARQASDESSDCEDANVEMYLPNPGSRRLLLPGSTSTKCELERHATRKSCSGPEDCLYHFIDLTKYRFRVS